MRHAHFHLRDFPFIITSPMDQQQFDLPGFSAPSTQLPVLPVPRLYGQVSLYFLALIPDETAAWEIESYATHARETHGFTQRMITRQCYHVTLHPVGVSNGLPEDYLSIIDGIISPIAASTPPIEMIFDLAHSHPLPERTPVFVLAGSAVNKPLKALFNTLGRIVPAPLKRFIPHLSLVYDDHIVPHHVIPTIRWTAREIVLVESLQGLGTHIHRHRWKLGTPSN